MESVHIFDPKTGKKVQSIFGGTKGSANIAAGRNNSKDAVVTHKHPSGQGKTGWKAIGNSFSGADLSTAIEFDMAEIRAVTHKYTFSMKRPKGGWGVSKADFMRAYTDTNNQVHREFEDYINTLPTRRPGGRE